MPELPEVEVLARRLHGVLIGRRIREATVLRHKICRPTDPTAQGSTVPLSWSGQGTRDRLFYYGRDPAASGRYEERLRVYDRENEPCPRCRTLLRRLAQGARSTFFCPACQSR